MKLLKKKKIIIGCVIGVCLIACAVLAYKYRRPVVRFIKQVLMHEGQITGLSEVSGSDWREVKVADLSGDNITINQSLMLINTEHMLPDDFCTQVSEYKTSGVYMNDCIMDSYALLAGEVLKRFETKLFVRSAYRTAQEQEQEVSDNSDNATAVGASEHQAGLALDVYVKGYAGMGFMDCDAGTWVNENCGDYGFIIRYPSYGKDSTGIGYEPWHIRYVGYPHSKIIMSSKTTFEKYVEYLKCGVIYSYENYYIYRSGSDDIKLPSEYKSVCISPDNLGGYIITVEK